MILLQAEAEQDPDTVVVVAFDFMSDWILQARSVAFPPLRIGPQMAA